MKRSNEDSLWTDWSETQRENMAVEINIGKLVDRPWCNQREEQVVMDGLKL